MARGSKDADHGPMEPALLLVLTGPPGAGKTTVAARLAATSELAVHLRGDEFWRFVARGATPPYLDGSRRQNEVVASALGAAAAAYAQGGYFTVLDAVIGPWLLAPLLQRARLAAIDLAYVVLRPRRDVAMARALGRQVGELRDPAPITRMYDAFADLGPWEGHVVDSSEQTPEETAADVLAKVYSEAARIGARGAPEG
jgi:adenylate kinase family enzyme